MPRNSSGTYSLPSGNPVVSNTLIETNWANPTMADIGQALTESLDRYGRGGMLAPFRLFDGTVTAPALSFASETSTGIYRTTAGTWNLAILGVNVFAATGSGVTIVPTTTFSNPAIRAADPATGNELTRKTYVDNAISAATGGGLTYVKRAGDTMTGALQITANQALAIRSGLVSLAATINIGRTAVEGYFGVSGGAGNFTTGDVAGDMTLRSEQRLWLSIGAAGYMRFDSTGILARYGFQAVGDLTPAVQSGMRLGVSSGQPNVVWSYMAGAADGKYWDTYAGPSGMYFRALNDANTAALNWMEVLRTGMSIGAVNFPNGPVTMAATAAAGFKLNVGGGGVYIRDDNGLRIVDTPSLVGTSLVSVAGFGTRLISDTRNIAFNSAGVDRMLILPSGAVGIGRTPVAKTLEVQGGIGCGFVDPEALRLTQDGAYIAFYNSANAVRSGYIQMNSAGDNVFTREAPGNIVMAHPAANSFVVSAAGATRLYVDSTGAYSLGTTANDRLVKRGEFAAGANSGAIPGLVFRFGRVAATVGVAGTITFAGGAFSTAQLAIVASLDGGVGGGFVLRTYTHTVNGFQYAFDNYNTAGSGAACTIVYWAVGY